MPSVERVDENSAAEKFATPTAKSIDDLVEQYGVPEERCAKALVYFADETPYLIFMSGNDQLNEAKLQTALKANNIRPAHDGRTGAALTGAHGGSIGPINLKSKIPQSRTLRLEHANGLVSGANENGFHYRNIDLDRDANIDRVRRSSDGAGREPDPVKGLPLKVKKAIEVGHISSSSARSTAKRSRPHFSTTRAGASDHHGQLRHRCRTHRGLSYRAASRQGRHLLASLHRTVPHPDHRRENGE
jgi:prolyl-tRNA synthetase